MKKRPPFKVPPLHDEAFAAAVDTYRVAFQHGVRVEAKWAPREEEVYKADEFSRLSVAHENEKYMVQKMCEWAGDMLKSAVRRGRPFPEHVYCDNFDRYVLKDAKKVLEKLRATYKLVNGTKLTPL